MKCFSYFLLSAASSFVLNSLCVSDTSPSIQHSSVCGCISVKKGAKVCVDCGVLLFSVKAPRNQEVGTMDPII